MGLAPGQDARIWSAKEGNGINVTNDVPPAAKYNRNGGGGGYAGADAAWSEWTNRGQNNPYQSQGRAAATGAAGYAASEAGRQRGPQAVENAELANREASGAGGHQQGATDLAYGMSLGNMPSAAAYQLQAGLDMGMAGQQASARSARGGAAMATAEQDSGANQAAMQQNAFTQGGMLRAQEMAYGRGLYGSMLGTQREQDQQRLGMGNDMARYNAEQNDRYSLGMGQAAVGLQGAAAGYGDLDLADYGQGMNSINAQSEAEQAYRSWLSNAEKQKVNHNTQTFGGD
jgi:hypothetical protein